MFSINFHVKKYVFRKLKLHKILKIKGEQTAISTYYIIVTFIINFYKKLLLSFYNPLCENIIIVTKIQVLSKSIIFREDNFEKF